MPESKKPPEKPSEKLPLEVQAANFGASATIASVMPCTATDFLGMGWPGWTRLTKQFAASMLPSLRRTAPICTTRALRVSRPVVSVSRTTASRAISGVENVASGKLNHLLPDRRTSGTILAHQSSWVRRQSTRSMQIYLLDPIQIAVKSIDKKNASLDKEAGLVLSTSYFLLRSMKPARSIFPFGRGSMSPTIS